MTIQKPTREEWLRRLTGKPASSPPPSGTNGTAKGANGGRGRKKKGHIAHSPGAMHFELTGEVPKDNPIFDITKNLNEEQRKQHLEKSALHHLEKPKDGKVNFPALLTMGNFFTLSSDTRAFAEVPFHTTFEDKLVSEGRLIRGKKDPASPTALGQLTSFDLKVFIGVLQLWAEQGYPVMRAEDPKDVSIVGVIRCSQYALVKKVFPNLHKPGKRDKQLIQDSLSRLESRPCCVVLPAVDREYTFSFKLLLNASVRKLKVRSTEETSLKIELGAEITEQFRLKHFLVRSIANLTDLKGELPRLLYLYLEPRLLSIPEGSIYNKNLGDLIEELGLPEAKWHKFPSQRQKIFNGVIAELNGKLSSKDGLQFELKIERGTQDFKLVATLKPALKKLADASAQSGSPELTLDGGSAVEAPR